MPYASFYATYGRLPIPGVDYDPNAPMCEDDYHYFMGLGDYSNTTKPEVEPLSLATLGLDDDHAEEEAAWKDYQQQISDLRHSGCN